MSGADQPRSEGTGRWIRTAEGVERDKLCVEMRQAGRTWQTIADTLGYSDRSTAQRGYKTAMAEVPGPDVAAIRQEMLDQLDHLQEKAMAVLEAKHIRINDGEVVYADGEQVIDDAPVLRAADTIRALMDRRAKLLGLDAPVKAEVEVSNVTVRLGDSAGNDLTEDL